jgi:hypothetical protein
MLSVAGAGDVAWGMGPDGTAGNQPAGTIIKSNFAYRCGLFEKQSSFYFQAKSRANVIQNNIFFREHSTHSTHSTHYPASCIRAPVCLAVERFSD